MSGMYDDAVEQLNEDAPAWLASRRQKGLEAWATAAMPASNDEDWLYIDLDFSLDDFRPADGQVTPMDDAGYLDGLSNRVGRITMVDGCVVSAESDGPLVGSVGSVDAASLAQRYGSAVSPDVDVFSAAHHALSPAGAVVVLPKNTVAKGPVVVDVQSVADSCVSFPHITIIAEPNSEGSVVVVYRSADSAELLTSPIVEAFADEGARLTVSVVQNMSDDARLVAHHHYVVGRDATLKIDEIGLGGSYARQRMGIDLDGAGGSVNAGGIYFGDRSQVLDYRINVTHRGQRTSSDIFLKGAVADQAEAVWTGLMRIEHGANGTSAFETNRNLVLSDGAKVNSVPNLEILTDDLQCGHGSSSGPLDEDHMYYLMSRGLHRDRAERLLMRGFFDEILSKLAVSELADPARVAVAAKFAAAQERGTA
jgi:Fe-S cluster assembly protein SufD